MIKVRTAKGGIELPAEERRLLRAVLREIRQAEYLFTDDPHWPEILELLAAVRAERVGTVQNLEVEAERTLRLRDLAQRMFAHLGPDEFRTRAGADLREAEDFVRRLSADAS